MSREAKKKQAVCDEQVSYLQVTPVNLLTKQIHNHLPEACGDHFHWFFVCTLYNYLPSIIFLCARRFFFVSFSSHTLMCVLAGACVNPGSFSLFVHFTCLSNNSLIS